MVDGDARSRVSGLPTMDLLTAHRLFNFPPRLPTEALAFLYADEKAAGIDYILILISFI
jgi:hypothetical protein